MTDISNSLSDPNPIRRAMSSIHARGLVLVGVLALASCSATAPQTPAARNMPAQTAEATPSSPFSEPPEAIIYGHFDQDTLARVIIAEMAGQRGHNDRALEDYLALARDTHDLGIIRRASRIATFMGNPRAATEMTQLWLQQEPDSVEAYQTQARQMLVLSRYGDALESMNTLLDMGSPIDFRLIPARLESDAEAGLYRRGLIADLMALSQRHPGEVSMRLALAQLYQQNDQTEEALILVRALAAEMDNPVDIILLEVELLEALGRSQDAVARLRSGVKLHPDDQQMRFQYGRALVSMADFSGASEQFAALVALDPSDYDMLYSLALINLEMNHLREAQVHLENLVAAGHRSDDAHYYLGFIHNQYNESDEAIDQYLRVDGGNNFLQAQRDLAELLVGQGRYPEARQRLQRLRYTAPDFNLPLISLEAGVLIGHNMTDEASRLLNASLLAYPDNLQLLYLRSVLSTNLNDLTLMEQDLRRMIEINPDDPTAWNTLGYVLADRTDRLDEAYQLILRASQLSPTDPAIMDSLGWVQYKLGMYEEALENLEQAFDSFPDHEVAAHLGEVRWMMGDRRGAMRQWRQALESQPQSEFVRETMQRLMPAGDS